MARSRAHGEVLDGGAERRRVVAVVAAGLLASTSVVFVSLFADGAAGSDICGPGGELLPGVPGVVACVHEDVPPPGVDVTEPVSTAELKAREGAGPAAFEAAEELGVPTSVGAAATTPAVRCDGDGTSGYRVQAMYVVEAGRTNRFAELQASFKLWAAGVDDVVNRSAALTGGVRNVRFVTEAGAGGTCEAKVLNVTVPAGSLASFGSSIGAVEALGYSNPTRKYLMWTDTSVLCGVALMYLDDQESQGNANNGRYPQYARTDSGCWGFGNGAGSHSVEAHELLHALGGVQRSARNSTAGGHCTDESDTMCYNDGGATMRQVCPVEREYLFDCNTDDYFSTYPDPGAYLDTHWNSADSRFLIGGGDGSGGGTTGSPTVLGATIGVNNPAVPGLSTQVEVAPALPAGRSLTSVRWKSARSDCTFSAPDELQSEVTCSASASGSTTVTATLVDSTGATKIISSPLTFSAGAARPVTLGLTVAGQSGAASVCTGAPFPVRATVTDVATGRPVKGLSVRFTKQTPTMTAAGTAGSAASQLDGAATVNGTATVPTTYAASTAPTARYLAASTASTLTATPEKCSPVIAGAAGAAAVYHGDSLRVSGTLTRTVDGAEVPVAGASLPVRLSYVSGGYTRVVTLGTARTQLDGSWTLTAKPTVSGTLSVSLAASTAYHATTLSLGALTVHLPSTELTASADRTDVGYGDPVVVTGRLTKASGALTTGELTAGVPSATVVVKVTAPGRTAATVASGRTLADGTFRISVPLRLSGAMTVHYAGASGLPADSVAIGQVTAGTWTSAVSLGATPYSTGYTLSGSVTKAYAGTTKPAPAVRVKVYFTPASTGVPALVSTVSTTTTGTYTARVYPKVSGSYQVAVSGVVGYTDSSSSTFSVTR